MKWGTQLLHGIKPDAETGAVSVPIYQVSTFHQHDFFAPPQPYQYSRGKNPTRQALEDLMAMLENGKYGFAYSSGVTAIASTLAIFKAGDHVLMCKDVYGGSYCLATDFFKKFNLEVTFVDTTNTESVSQAIKYNTVALYLESPSNPLLRVTNLKTMVAIAKQHSLLTIIDNTFMSPYYQRPLDLGIDIVLHSATKFIGGHSDVLAGIAVTKDEAIATRLKNYQNQWGGVLGPQDCWLLLRGLKTLKIRMEQQQANAQLLIAALQKHANVETIYYPLLDKNKDAHQQQATGGGCVFSFDIKNKKSLKKFFKSLQFAVCAVSLGGVETIVSYPVKTSHSGVPKEELQAMGISDSLVRVSVGIEDADDLVADFVNALN